MKFLLNSNKIEKILPDIILGFFREGHPRSLKAKKQASVALIYRGLNIFLGLLLVPLALYYLNPESYGIVMVLFSMSAWFSFLNIGADQGFRNKFAEALAEGNKEKAKYYVSTTYAFLSVVFISFLLIFVFINRFLDWTKILNTSPDLRKELSILALFVFGSFCLSFILQIVITMLIADQKPSVLVLKNLIEQAIKLLAVLILIYTTTGTVLKFGIVYSITPVIVLLFFSFYYFSNKYREFLPSFRYIHFSYLKKIMTLGLRFFILQIAGVVLFMTDNIIITQLFGPEQVTPYQIAQKFFSIPLTIFMIILSPLWSAATEAFYNKDFVWIKSTIRKLIKLWVVLSIGVIFMILVSPYFYHIWIGDIVYIPILLSIFWGLFIVIQTFNNIFVSFINGTGKITLQQYGAIFSMIINIPLSIYLAKYLNLGISGVILATVFCQSLSLIYIPIQYIKIINRTATGIWNK